MKQYWALIAGTAMVISGLVGIRKDRKMKRVFIAFAIEDRGDRDLFVGQRLNSASPVEFIDYSVHEPWSNEWKEKCRARIRSSAGVIALTSSNLRQATGALWEIQCAIEERKPLIGVRTHHNDMYVPEILVSRTVIPWTWDGVASFVNSLP